MDAVEYLKERERWSGEDADFEYKYSLRKYEANDPVEAVRMVEKWSARHPRMTNRQKFKEVFGMVPAESGNIRFGFEDFWLNAEYIGPEAGA